MDPAECCAEPVVEQLIDEPVVLEARRLLTRASDSGAQIADRLGFDGASNFSKYSSSVRAGPGRIQNYRDRSCLTSVTGRRACVANQEHTQMLEIPGRLDNLPVSVVAASGRTRAPECAAVRVVPAR